MTFTTRWLLLFTLGVIPLAFGIFAPGFGGITIESAKSVNICISASGIWSARPTRPGKATMKFMNASCESKGGAVRVSVPNAPETRSPRQCIGPLFTMPRSVCVVIGPFIG